jgi:hypothetical protein
MNQTFIGQLLSYKKGDLRALAIALALSDKGTNAELLSWIKDHLDQHLGLQSNQRFSGLFPKQNRLTQDANALINATLLPTRNGKYSARSVQWIYVDYILFLQVLIFIFRLWMCPQAPIKHIHTLAKCDGSMSQCSNPMCASHIPKYPKFHPKSHSLTRLFLVHSFILYLKLLYCTEHIHI